MIVTLHYRIALADGTEVLSTFGGTPATLSLGAGELAEGLERCVAESEPGRHYVYLLESAQAFGPRREDLVQRMPRASFPAGMPLSEGVIVEFSSPDGATPTGVVRETADADVLVDFNHPLAGRDIRFEVEVLSRL